MQIEPKIALGLYSDSAANEISLSLYQTDGLDISSEPLSMIWPYPAELKEELLRFSFNGDLTDTAYMKDLSARVTAFHLDVIHDFIDKHKRTHPHIDLMGYPGHAVYHSPKDKVHIDLGDPETITDDLGIPVVSRFIQSDLKAGGCGGPMFPTFYDALTRNLEKPLVLVSLRGVTSMTYIGAFGQLKAFDVGIGTLLLDGWMMRHTGSEMDFDGTYGARGQVDERLLKYLLKNPFLHQEPPKTLDKEKVMDLLAHLEGSKTDAGAATITAFIAGSIAAAQKFLPEKPSMWVFTGGGISNPTLMRMIRQELNVQTHTSAELGWQKGTLEAMAYAFLAVRSIFGLPISFPQTSGVHEPVSGGRLYVPQKLLQD